MLLRVILGIIVGAAAGFGWHKLVGCSTGSCPLAASPYLSSIFGAVVGALVANALR